MRTLLPQRAGNSIYDGLKIGLSTPRERKFTGLLDNLVVERTHFSPLNKRNKKAFDLNRLKQKSPSASPRIASETISVPVQYLQWQPLYETERPFLRLFKPPPESEDDRATNLVFETKSVDLQDIRELDTSPTLDSHGFQIVESATQITDFQIPVVVNEKYLAECERVLKATVGDADEVFCCDWRVRDSASQKRTNNVKTSSKPATSTSGGMRSDDVQRARAYDPENRAAMLSPALLVHIGK
ncbi:hypothetical protein BKA61DRAFT_569031 [Leptodontidium sp. MPI-SDFR-AT-0119]|nr:hypothetical protein BKA61DRAFT_569031 [Leptodontidium sp. MPI-SDFR-AT-0119]